MATYQQEQRVTQAGMIAKEIDYGGMPLVFDTLQRYQYQYPIKSTVREILSNGVDSVREREMAKEILSGRARVEDYFEQQLDGPLYKDSKFKPDYYDLNFLSDDSNVYMTYVVGSGSEKDHVVIFDPGVGLGGDRLRGYFSLAYSTKRLSKLPLGKFGLGAKAPLSIDGVDFYVMESWHNGRYYKFQILNEGYFSLIPKFDLEKGQQNPFITFTKDDGSPVLGADGRPLEIYYEATDQKNGVQITIETKKHHKSQYIDAVKSQMLYFPAIKLGITENGLYREEPYRAQIMYEDALIVMSDNQYYSKPHILLNGVNYGYVDWKELELQEITGNIGIKVLPEDVDVNTSREAIRWTERTKATVLQRLDEVVDIATKEIQQQLDTTDFLQWWRTCQNIAGFMRADTVVGRLSKIVDLSRMELAFGPAPELKYNAKKGPGAFDGIFRRGVSITEVTEKGITTRKVRRSFDWSLSDQVVLVPKGTNASNRKDKYLLSLYGGKIVHLYEPYYTYEEMLEANLGQDLQEFYEKASEKGATMEHRRKAWEAISASEQVLRYEDIEVPEHFSGTDEELESQEGEEEEEMQEKVRQQRASAEERRKLEGKINMQSLSTSGTYLAFNRFEVPIKSINDWDAPEIYYGNEEHSEMLILAALFNTPVYGRLNARPYAENFGVWAQSKWYRLNQDRLKALCPESYSPSWWGFSMPYFFDANVMLVKVSQGNTRYVRDFQPVTEFFMKIKNHTITMSQSLIKWNTARLLMEKLDTLAFLYNYEPINPELAQKYKQLTDYVDRHYRDVENKGAQYGFSGETYQTLVAHLDTVKKFQDFVRLGRPATEIAQLAEELFTNPTLQDGMAYEPEMLEYLRELEEYAIAVGPLLNQLPVLTGYLTDAVNGFAVPGYKPNALRYSVLIPEDVEYEIRKFLESRGVLNYRVEQAPTATAIPTMQEALPASAVA